MRALSDFIHRLTAPKETDSPSIDLRHQIKESGFLTSKRILLGVGALVGLWFLHTMLDNGLLSIARDVVVALIYGLSFSSAANYIANAMIRKAEIETDIHYERLKQEAIPPK